MLTQNANRGSWVLPFLGILMCFASISTDFYLPAAVAALIVALNAATGWGGLAGLAIPLLVYIAMNGFIVANSIAGAMAAVPERAGALSALVGALQYGAAILGSSLVGAFANGTPWPMGWVIALSALGGLACVVLLTSARAARRLEPA